MNLDRASQAYRRGYNDALNRRDMVFNKDTGTFESHDYVEGYLMRLNEVYWDAHHDNRHWDENKARRV